MRVICIIILSVAIFSCKAKENELIDIDFNPAGINPVRLNDSGMEQNARRVYREESDANIVKILDKPFENIEISIFSEYSHKRVFNGIEELLNIFNKNIDKNIIDKFNSSDLYKTIKISIENVSLYVYREYNNTFKLFFVEYKDNYLYEPKLKIGYSKNDIINLLGEPLAYSTEGDLFIYDSQETLRQINIFFENDVVRYIQLISWGGI